MDAGSGLGGQVDAGSGLRWQLKFINQKRDHYE